MHILGLPTDIFNVYPASIKYKTYQTRWQIGDIYVSGDARKTEDNPQGLGCYLVMTGRGCDDIFRILDSRNCTFGDMFKHCERRYGQDNFHFTRLDIAIDDKNEKPFFYHRADKEENAKKRNLSRIVRATTLTKASLMISTPQRLFISVLVNRDCPYRFYDKDKEVCSKHNKTLEEVGSWKRTEMQLRDDKAHAFAMTFKERPLELGELAFGLLANNLRFVVPNRNESNKSRWKTCRFWERFLGAVEVLKLQVPKQQNSLEETQQWLTEGGVISAVKSFYFLEEHDALGGLEKVGTMLDKARYSNSLSSKLTAHLQRINRTDLIPYIQYDTKHGKGGI